MGGDVGYSATLGFNPQAAVQDGSARHAAEDQVRHRLDVTFDQRPVERAVAEDHAPRFDRREDMRAGAVDSEADQPRIDLRAKFAAPCAFGDDRPPRRPDRVDETDRSEEHRVGKEGVSTGRSWWSA